MDLLLIYALSIYFTFHFFGRSDIMRRPREWATMALPKWVVYIFTCAFCWTFHAGLALMLLGALLTGHLFFSVTYLFAAPVVNLVLDLIVQGLLRWNAPLIQVFSQTPSTSTTEGMLFTSEGKSWSTDARGYYVPSVPPSPPSSSTPFNPLDHEQTK